MNIANSAGARVFSLLPRQIARKLAQRYLAGESISEAIAVATRLRDRNLHVTLDVLGESVRSRAAAARHVDDYLATIDALVHTDITPHVSVKPSGLGSLIDQRLCEEHLKRVADHAGKHGGTVCVDMEWAGTTGATISLYHRLREAGANVSTVLQARLHRTHADVLALMPHKPSIRICKGIYPEAPSIAYTDGEAIRLNYRFCLEDLLAANGYTAIATHDEALIVSSLEALARYKRSQETYEFQMLLGVREDLAAALASAGHTVRIYVPFGREWRSYASRRLRESPQLVGYAAKAFTDRVATSMIHRHRGTEGAY